LSASTPQGRSSQFPALRVPCHCPEAEYAALIRRVPLSAEWRKKHLAYHQRFVRTHPEVAAWSAQPLRERLGWRGPEGQNQRSGPGDGFDATTGWINFKPSWNSGTACACPRKARANATST
jgi:hypothetical protein